MAAGRVSEAERRLAPPPLNRIPNGGHLMWMDAPGDCASALRALKP